ncbi:MAG TPA: molybdate ABC transporter substrate-binding protein, partial [Polyangiaceae bacterium]|nr:molybdate ABC transporter substrate-binding protein [Polyangiaceae bacterium]
MKHGAPALGSLLLLALLFVARLAAAAEIQVAVASNFTGPMQELARQFEQKTGDHVVLVSGATGKLAAQIEQGAPFELLLAADERTPSRLESAGLTVPGTRFTYAFGKLALYSSKSGFVDGKGAVLRGGHFRHLALANPKLAPYGAAAIAVLKQLQLLDSLQPKLVEGENISQTLEFVTTGNAELGFVALSQILLAGKPRAGSYWLVPESMYAPIR